MSFGKKKTFGGSTYTAPVEPVPPTKAPEPMQTVMVNGVPHIPINGQLIPIGGSKVNWLMILLGLVLAAIIIGGSLLLLRSEFGGGGGSEPVIEISAAEDAGRDIQQYIPKLAALYAEAAKKARSGEFRDGVAANEFIKPKKKEIGKTWKALL